MTASPGTSRTSQEGPWPSCSPALPNRCANLGTHGQRSASDSGKKVFTSPRAHQLCRSQACNSHAHHCGCATGGIRLYVMDQGKALPALANLAGLPGITQQEAADALGLGRRTIARREVEGWELSELLQLADIYKVSRTRLLMRLGHLDETDVYEVSDRDAGEGVTLDDLSAQLAALQKRINQGVDG